MKVVLLCVVESGFYHLSSHSIASPACIDIKTMLSNDLPDDGTVFKVYLKWILVELRRNRMLKLTMWGIKDGVSATVYLVQNHGCIAMFSQVCLYNYDLQCLHLTKHVSLVYYGMHGWHPHVNYCASLKFHKSTIAIYSLRDYVYAVVWFTIVHALQVACTRSACKYLPPWMCNITLFCKNPTMYREAPPTGGCTTPWGNTI